MSRTLTVTAGLALAGLFAWGQSTVSLYFTVEDGDKLIGGLQSENFRLYEDGQPVRFRLVEPESPALVTLLAEYSQSSLYYLNDIGTALHAFVDAAPEGHWYSLATFSQELQIHVDFTRQKGEIRAAFGALGQPLWGEVNTYLSDSARMELRQAEAFMNMLARKTGGQSFFPRFETAYRDVMRTVVLMLEQQYRIVYESRFGRDGRFHRIRLEAFQTTEGKRHNFSVRVREGWRRQ